MSSQGATLQAYNNELVKCMEDLKQKREELHEQILAEQEEKEKIQSDLHLLSEQLARVSEGLNQKMGALSATQKALDDAQQAYAKILESSQTLLHVLKRETVSLSSSGRRL